MQTRSSKPSLIERSLTAAAAIGCIRAAFILILTLGMTGVYASIHPASLTAAELSFAQSESRPGSIQLQRVESIQELRAENLADFDAMEQAPGLYTEPESPASVQRDRVTEIEDLRAQNVADFRAMEQSPGLYTQSD